jgi:hypothetical protein
MVFKTGKSPLLVFIFGGWGFIILDIFLSELLYFKSFIWLVIDKQKKIIKDSKNRTIRTRVINIKY